MAEDHQHHHRPVPISADEVWRIYLTEGGPALQKYLPAWMRVKNGLQSGFFRIIPTDPRCMWCDAPFRGMGAPLMNAIGRGQSNRNPNVCSDCENMIKHNRGGAEVDLTMVFADIRGSTSLAEKISPTEFKTIIDRFFRVVSDELIRGGALIDKLIGDEVTAFFVPGLAGKDHARSAVKAAQLALLKTGHAGPDGPWVPVGVGIHTGEAYVGVVGHADSVMDLTVLGDVPNTAARLAAQAAAGEIVISDKVAEVAHVDTSGLESKQYTLKGKSEPFDAWVLKVSPQRSRPLELATRPAPKTPGK